MNKISEFISKNESLLIPVLLLTLVLFFAAFEKKKKIPLVSLIVTALALLIYFAARILPDFTPFGIPLQILAAGFACLALLVNLIFFAIYNALFYKRLNLVRVAANSIGTKIFAYLDSKARVIAFTEEFADLLGLKKNKKKYYEEAVSKILVDSQEMGLNVFVHYIGTQEERDYRVVLTLADERTLKLDLKKRKVISSGNLLGYVLMSFGIFSADAEHDNASLKNYLNFLDEPIYYYDFKLRKYVLTQQMMNLLGVSENLLGENNFLSVVVAEDLPLISERNLSEKIQKIYYRLKTTKGDLWFEESSINFEGHKYLIAHKTDFARFKMNFLDQKSLTETTRLVYERNNWLALALVKILNYQKIKQQVGKDACDVIVSRFFLQAINELSLTNSKVFHLEDAVFVLIFDKNDAFNRLLSLLSKENNLFIRAEIKFNESKYNVETAVGIISSANAEDSRAETLLRDGYEALQLAQDPKYTQNYSIYVPKAKIDVDLEEMGIDLSDDFFDAIVKE